MNIHHYSYHQSIRPHRLKLISESTAIITHVPMQFYSNFPQPFLLTTISNSSYHNFALNHDFELACLSMLMVIINPDLNIPEGDHAIFSKIICYINLTVSGYMSKKCPHKHCKTGVRHM